MDVQTISDRAFSVYITEPELELRKLDPRGITKPEAMALVGSVIHWEALDAVTMELFPGRHELMIFVRRSRGEPEFFAFPDLESLLEALRELGGAAASVYFYQGGYILAVWAGDAASGSGLEEFGTPLRAAGAFLLHLREHAEVISEGDAGAIPGYFDEEEVYFDNSQ